MLIQIWTINLQVLPISIDFELFSLYMMKLLYDKFLSRFIADKKSWFYVVFCIALSTIISVQQYSNNRYNNFTIFRSSFGHLLHNRNLYSFYPREYEDVFLYNPSFAVFFAPFNALSVLPAMIVWLTIAVLSFVFAISKLPFSKQVLAGIFLLCLPDCINSMQYFQSNTISIAFIILTWAYLKEEKPYIAGLLTAFLFFIKIYPAACGLFFLFFPHKFKYVIGVLFFSGLFLLLPLLYISPQQLIQQYQNWYLSLQNDSAIDELGSCLSLISLNFQWLRHPVNVLVIQITGLLITLFPLTKHKMFEYGQWQLNYLCAIALFIIIFNHAAESATYVIAVAGVAIWYFNNRVSTLNNILLIFVIIGTILIITDIVPAHVKKISHAYSVRVIPCTLVWMKIISDLLKPATNQRYASF